MLDVWGRKNSSNVVPVMWTIGELGLEHVRHNAGGSFGGLDTPEYAAMNPNGLVPTIRDNGFALWESQAIIRYLARTYGHGGLMPDDPQQAAVADQWMEWSAGTANRAIFPVFWSLVRTEPAERDMAAVAAQARRAGETLRVIDNHLADRAFVAGETLTVGDIPLGAMMYRYVNLDIERPELPNLERWYARLCERPAYQEHVMNEFGASPTEWALHERRMHGLEEAE